MKLIGNEVGARLEAGARLMGCGGRIRMAKGRRRSERVREAVLARLICFLKDKKKRLTCKREQQQRHWQKQMAHRKHDENFKSGGENTILYRS